MKEREKECLENGVISSLTKIIKMSDDPSLKLSSLNLLHILAKNSKPVCAELKSFGISTVICNDIFSSSKGTGLISNYLEALLNLNLDLL